MTNPWHVVRTVNFLLALPKIEGYKLFFVRAGFERPFPILRLVWRKDRFRIKTCNYSIFRWKDIEEDDRIEDNFGRVFLRGSDLKGESNP